MLVQHGMVYLTIGDHEKRFEDMYSFLKERHSGFGELLEIREDGKWINALVSIAIYKLFCEEFGYDFVDYESNLIERMLITQKSKISISNKK